MESHFWKKLKTNQHWDAYIGKLNILRTTSILICIHLLGSTSCQLIYKIIYMYYSQYNALQDANCMYISLKENWKLNTKAVNIQYLFFINNSMFM